MDTNSKDSEPLETKESALHDAENTSLLLGNGRLVTQKHAPEVTPDGCTPDTFKSPLDFSTVTVEQLGITPESFVKNSSGKSPSYLKKSRRRSTIGVRGSPETNHLIRFIAQQRNLKNTERSSLTQTSPFLGSPVLYRNVNSLRERMSAFQSAFHCIKENENMMGCPEFSEADGEVKTTGSTKKEGFGQCPQFEFAADLSSKRRRISSPGDSDGNLPDAVHLQMSNRATSPHTGIACAADAPLADLPEKSFESGSVQSGYLVEESVSLSDLTEASSGVRVAEHVEGKGPGVAVSLDNLTEMSTDAAPQVWSLVTPPCKRAAASSETFVLRSVLKKPSVNPLLESLQEHCDNLWDDGTHPSLISNLANCCKEQTTEGQENCKVPAFLNVRKRKRVTFGEDLSPEVFDETLPANTPLRKGGTPVRKNDLSSISPLLLEQSPVPAQLSQPDFDDKGEDLENIEPLQVSFAVLSPLNKSSISETLSGIDPFSSSDNHEKTASLKVGRITRASNRRSQLITFVEENVCNLLNTEAQPCKEKKINRRKSQESKHTARVHPKKSQALKSCRRRKAKGKKSVQKSLYGERDIASKKPLLSPIPELPEVPEMTPSTPGAGMMCSDDFDSSGELQEAELPHRKNILPQKLEDLQSQGFNKSDLSAFCSSYTRSSSLLIDADADAALGQDLNGNTVEANKHKALPKAEVKSESENELRAGPENESSPVAAEVLASDDAGASTTLPSRELAAAGHNVENLFQIFNISDDVNIKYEKQHDVVTASEGKLPTTHATSGSQKGVFIDSVRESAHPSAGSGRNCRESGSPGTNGGGKKRRRRSLCYSDGQSFCLGKNGNNPSYLVSSPVEAGLGNSDLYKDLSDSIEQTFQRTSRETKVRRSTRLQKDLEDEGLVWISLPFPSAPCRSQRLRRRTVCTVDSRGLESVALPEDTEPSGQTLSTVLPVFVSGEENRDGLAASALSLPGRRRKSMCTATLTNTKGPAQPKCYRRRSSLHQRRECSLTASKGSGTAAIEAVTGIS